MWGFSIEEFIRFEQSFVWVILVLTILYFWSTHTYGYWKGLGVPYKQPVPLFGNFAKTIFNITPNPLVQKEIYDHLKGNPFGGFYRFMTPVLMLRDPALIEQVAIKDFSSFTDRGTGVDPDGDGLNAHLVNMVGQRWKSLRTKLTPVFTSGKLKGMMSQLDQCSVKLCDYLSKKSESSEPYEAKQVMSGYTLDVIGSCAFGLDFNAINDPNSSFRKLGEKVFSSSKIMMIKMWIRQKWPKLFRLINMSNLSLKMQNSFLEIIKNSIKIREEKNIKRNDFIQLLMEVRNQEKIREPTEHEVVMDDKVMASNSFVFLLAGYETTASTISFLLYELSVNPDIQKRVHKEVVQVLKKHNGEISWETLKDMVYLEQVITETLRKYTPAVEIRRTCTKDYIFPGRDLEIPAGTIVSFPVFSIHHDPQYYPDPEKFDPDRFSEENKHKIVKCTYLPFGEGPRICIGMRFAQMEVKMAVARLIEKFSVTLHPKTISPLKFNPGGLLLTTLGGIWVNFHPRKNVTT